MRSVALKDSDVSTSDLLWRGEHGALKKALTEANKFPQPARSSAKLSAYISVAKKEKGVILLWHTLLMLVHSKVLMGHSEDLTINQLDVLLTFLLKLDQKSVVLRRLVAGRVTIATRLIERAERLVLTSRLVPHQIALLYLTIGKSLLVWNITRKVTTRECISFALALECKIRLEDNKVLALRQLVRILRKGAELEMEFGEYHMAKYRLREALELALGPADAADQVSSIEELLAKTEGF